MHVWVTEFNYGCPAEGAIVSPAVTPRGWRGAAGAGRAGLCMTNGECTATTATITTWRRGGGRCRRVLLRLAYRQGQVDAACRGGAVATTAAVPAHRHPSVWLTTRPRRYPQAAAATLTASVQAASSSPTAAGSSGRRYVAVAAAAPTAAAAADSRRGMAPRGRSNVSKPAFPSCGGLQRSYWSSPMWPPLWRRRL